MFIMEQAVYVILADGMFDQIVETKALASKEKADLKAMGYDVQVKGPMTWADADCLQCKMEGR